MTARAPASPVRPLLTPVVRWIARSAPIVLAMALVPGARAAAQGARPSFVLIVVDGLRSDRVSCEGAAAPALGVARELCEGGVAFTRAYAQSSWNPASVASLLTSRYPSGHGVRTGMDALRPGVRTLAAALREAGYATLGCSASRPAEQQGFGAGFDEFRLVPGSLREGGDGDAAARADRVTACVRSLLDASGAAGSKPLFVYARYLDPLLTDVPESEYLQPLAPPPFDISLWRDLSHRVRAFQTRFSAADLRRVVTAYDAAIAGLDAGLRDLWGTLAERGLLDNGWTILVGSTGEGLGEHGVVGHGYSLYEESVHVPLIVVPPRALRTSRSYAGIVELIDVPATILDLARVPADADVRGLSLRPALSGGMVRKNEAVSELMPSGFLRLHTKAVIRAGTEKRIERSDQKVETYDLDTDPRERENLAERDTIYRSVRWQLETWRAELRNWRAWWSECLLSRACRNRMREGVRARWGLSGE